MPALSSYSRALLILFVLSSARAQNPATGITAGAKTSPKEKCALSGTVVAAATGVPLAKAEVILHPINPGDDTSYATTTGAEGKFLITGVEPGKYTLTINRDGYVSQSYNSNGSRHQPETFDLQPGQSMNDLKVALLAQAVIVGRVLDADGEPLPGVFVQCKRPAFTIGERTMTPANSASTNDLGEYRMFGLSPGKCYVSAERRGGTVLAQHVVVEGHSPEYVATYYPSTPDISSASAVMVSAGQTVSGVDITLLTLRTHRITGYVKNVPSGKSAFVQLIRADDSPNYFEATRFQMARGRDGYFEFTGVGTGNYIVSTQPVGSGNERVAASQAVSVGDSDVVNLILDLTPLPSLAAAIASGDPTACPPKNAEISLQPKSRLPFGGWAQNTADENGQLRLDGVALVPYSVLGYNLPDGCYMASIRLGDDAVVDGQVDFSQGIPTGPLAVTIRPRAPSVSGTVKDANDSPAAGVLVVVVPADPAQHWAALYHSTTTDQKGSYSFKNLIPGNYQVYAWEDIPPGAWQDPDILKQFSAKAVRLNLKAGDNANQDLTVIPASETKDIE